MKHVTRRNWMPGRILPIKFGRNPDGCLAQQRAFTLTEIFIVIAVIALLTILIVPAVQRSIEKAQSAGCVAKLRTLGTAMLTYEADNQHLIPGDDAAFWDPANFTWLSALREYCDLDTVRSCPAAPNPGGADLNNGDGNKWGSYNHAWAFNESSWLRPTGDPGYSSYGLNMWTRRAFMDNSPVERERASLGSTRVDDISKIPMMMDARWEGLWPVDTDPVPSTGALKNREEIPLDGAKWRMVDNLAMRRHGEGVNICFMDGSVRYVPLNELWTLKWNRNYEPPGPVNLF
jgi:prepilin-type processing-associated H-X9-DG protein